MYIEIDKNVRWWWIIFSSKGLEFVYTSYSNDVYSLAIFWSPFCSTVPQMFKFLRISLLVPFSCYILHHYFLMISLFCVDFICLVLMTSKSTSQVLSCHSWISILHFLSATFLQMPHNSLTSAYEKQNWTLSQNVCFSLLSSWHQYSAIDPLIFTMFSLLCGISYQILWALLSQSLLRSSIDP